MAGGGVVLASVVAVSIATLAPFAGRDDNAAVRVIVAHTPGTRLVGQLEATGDPGADVTVEVTVDGVAVVSDALPSSGGRAVGVVDVDLEPGAAELEVSLIEGGDRTSLYSGPVLLVEGRRFLVEARDVPPPPTVAEGRRVFDDNRLGGCNVCHSTKPGDDGVGPSLAGVATVAAGRVPGLDAAGYLRQSVLQPDAYVVPGWPAGQMIDEYDERLSADQIDAVVAYLLTLEEVGS
jgi:mono/diheme cytochrome c family protein